jgi:hypothetical protein
MVSFASCSALQENMRQQNTMKNKKEKKAKTIDLYTGEEVPVAEDAHKFVEVVPRETDDRKGQKYLLEEETSMDALAADENADEVARLSASYTEDEEIEADFAERQQLAVGGRKVLEKELDEHQSESPKLSGGDLDADWQSANQAGEETVGGSAPTPDQDVVDELGEAVGLTYEDDEPLQGEEKLRERDRKRWELNPASALEDQDDEDEPEDLVEE